MGKDKTPSGLELKEDLSAALYLVSFISLLSPNSAGYDKAADQMIKTVQKQTGFIAAYSARNSEGVGMTLSYWTDLEAIASWRKDKEHQAIQKKGKTHWYDWYQLQVSEIDRSYQGGRLL